MRKKYQLCEDQTINYEGKTLYRIQALISFGDVEEGHFGGYIEKEENLSHEGNCWAEGDTKIFDDAYVSDNAKIRNSEIYGNAKVFGNANISNSSEIYDNAIVCDNAEVRRHSEVFGNAIVSGNTLIDYSKIYEYAKVSGNTLIDDSKINGNTKIISNAIIKYNEYFTVQGIQNYNDVFTFYKVRLKKGKYAIAVNSGDYCEDLAGFKSRIIETYGIKEYFKIYRHIIKIAKNKIKIKNK